MGAKAVRRFEGMGAKAVLTILAEKGEERMDQERTGHGSEAVRGHSSEHPRAQRLQAIGARGHRSEGPERLEATGARG